MISDGELLRRYVENGSEAAFTELVQRHINVVYLAALRRVGRNAHAADDVTQKVFTDLARKAKSLHDRPNLAGWLYTSTRFASADVVRAEQRRRNYEEKAHTMHELDATTPDAAERLEPFLDEVMDLLNEQDREAVLLHFFEGRSFVETGAVLSLSADATRMRVNRALERLRTAFAQHGVTSTAAALSAVLSTQSALAAPASLALKVAGHALGHAGTFGAKTSAITRLFQGAKSSALLTGAGALLTLAIIGVAVNSHRGSAPATTAGLGGSVPAAITSTASNAGPDALAAAGVSVTQESAIDVTTPTVSIITGVARTTNLVSETTDRFSQLTEPEKNILAILWTLQKNSPPAPGARHAIKLPPDALNFDGVAPLVRQELVTPTKKDSAEIFLSPEGLNFCALYSAEIETHPIAANLRRSSTSQQEGNLLKLLWDFQKKSTPPPGSRLVMKISPNSPLSEARETLLAKGLVGAGPKPGGTYLTKAGRAFCEANLTP